MRTLITMFLICMYLLPLAVPVAANNPIERVILLYIDGFHPEAFEKYNLPNLELLKAGGTSAERGIMTLPVHPTIGAYGANHTTSLPNITTLAGTMFIDEKQHFFHHDLPDDYLTLHAGGSNAYRSMNDGFSYVLADAVSDKELIDFAINAFEKEGDIQFSRIHLQQAGYAGRIESGKQQNNVPWAQNIFAENSPYGKAVVNADDARINLLLMELMHSGLSAHQFYNYDRILEWKQAGSLQQMYDSNQWVINQLNQNLHNMNTSDTNSKPIYQIRIYELKESNKEQFFIRFRDHASRIMKRHGFDILKMWESNYNGKPEFVYLLKWEDEEALKQSWEKFFADEEWVEIRDFTNEKYGGLVGERKEDRLLKEVISVE